MQFCSYQYNQIDNIAKYLQISKSKATVAKNMAKNPKSINWQKLA